MRWFDLIALPLASLGQQKVKTCLTTLGVVFGAFVLAASLSIGEGVQQTIEREASRGNIARKVTVQQNWRVKPGAKTDEPTVAGRMTPERRERLRKVVRPSSPRANPEEERVVLTPERIAELARLPHVEQAVPLIGGGSVAFLGTRPEGASFSTGAGEDPEFRDLIVAGRGFDSETERSVLLSERFAHAIGLVDDADIDQVLGRSLRVEIRTPAAPPSFAIGLNNGTRPRSRNRETQAALRQLEWQLPDALDRLHLSADEVETLRQAISPPATKIDPAVVATNLRVVGIYREPTDDEAREAWTRFPARSDLVLPRKTALDLAFQDRNLRDEGADQVILYVDSMNNVRDVVKAVEGLGLSARSAVDFIERERLTYLLIFGGMTCVAGVALLVASLGIANTMLMSVLERRREIGIMKAVGATNLQLQTLFVVEGSLIGMVGGVFGLLLAWSLSIPGDAWVRSMVLRDMKINLKGSIFAFPGWVAATVVLFTFGVTTVAALYPARRAAKVDPVSALRHD